MKTRGVSFDPSSPGRIYEEQLQAIVELDKENR